MMTLLAMRQAAELTQEQTEEATGLDQSTISALESGRVKNPRHSTLTALARAYKRRVSDVAEALAETLAAGSLSSEDDSANPSEAAKAEPDSEETGESYPATIACGYCGTDFLPTEAAPDCPVCATTRSSAHGERR